jgi:hypothetical protein
MARKYPKKITTSQCGLNTTLLESIADQYGKDEKGSPTPVAVLRVYGRIVDTEKGQTTFGPFIKFRGEHEATNLIDSSVHRSKVLILPEVAEAALSDMLASGQSEDPKAIVTYALDVTVEYHKNAYEKGTKFRFGVQPLIESKKGVEDELSKLGKALTPPKMIPVPPTKKK